MVIVIHFRDPDAKNGESYTVWALSRRSRPGRARPGGCGGRPAIKKKEEKKANLQLSSLQAPMLRKLTIVTIFGV